MSAPQDRVASLKHSGDEIGHRELLEHAAHEARARNLEDVFIVDADFHLMEIHAWSEMLDYFDNDVVGHLLRTGARGRTWWLPASVETGTIQEAAGRMRSTTAWVSEAGAPGAEREVRLIREAMEMLCTDYVVLFPTTLLHLGTNPHVELEPHIARANARWMTERVLSEDPRILTLLYLPFGDPEASERLIEDFGDKPGVAGFMVTSVRNRVPVHDNAYARLYAMLEERGLPLGFHGGFDYYERSMEQFNKFLSVHAIGFPYYNMIHLTNWIINGMPERFPNLKVIFIESGLAWLPFLSQRLDHEFLMRSSEAPLLQRLPSDYIAECYYTSQPLESTNMSLLELTFDIINAPKQLLYSSDWPHWDFDLPSKIHDLPFLDDEARLRILGGNARELFKLEDARSRLPAPHGSSPSPVTMRVQDRAGQGEHR